MADIYRGIGVVGRYLPFIHLLTDLLIRLAIFLLFWLGSATGHRPHTTNTTLFQYDAQKLCTVQVAKDDPTRSSSKDPWAEVKYANKKRAAKKGNQRQGPGGKGDLISQGRRANKKVREGYYAT